MTDKLKKVKIEEVDIFVSDKDIVKQVKKEKPQIFRVANESMRQNITVDPLVNLEITLRKGERIGFFKK